MTAISDSSPLILFDRIGRLELLRSPFTEIVIPSAVQREGVTAGAGRPGSAIDGSAVWISVRAPEGLPSGARPFGPIGAGETEVIALALERGRGMPVLMDDLAGRRAAQQRNLLVMGSGGVLVRAKDLGLVASVKPLLDALCAAGLYRSNTAYDRILELAFEAHGIST